MAYGAVLSFPSGGIAETLCALTRAEGTAAHTYASAPALLSGASATRNLADVVHLLCELHGRHPGVIDHAVNRAPGGSPRVLDEAAQGFAEERAYLTRLVVAAGPLPSTPGQAESEAAVLGQRHALETLALSERTGCALGTAAALLLDWVAIRHVLDAAAVRCGVEVMPPALPSWSAIGRTLVDLTPGMERAVMFGAQQLLVQHRGLWDLLEARAVARRDH